MTLDDYRPHVVIECPDDTVRVVPLVLLENIARGKKDITDIDVVVIRAIIEEWINDRQTIKYVS